MSFAALRESLRLHRNGEILQLEEKLAAALRAALGLDNGAPLALAQAQVVETTDGVFNITAPSAPGQVYSISAFGNAQLTVTSQTLTVRDDGHGGLDASSAISSGQLLGDNSIQVTLDTALTLPPNCNFALQGTISGQTLQALAWMTGNNGSFNDVFASSVPVPDSGPYESVTATVTLAGLTPGPINTVYLTIAATGTGGSFPLTSSLSMTNATAALCASAFKTTATSLRSTAGWSLGGTVDVPSTASAAGSYPLTVTVMPSRSLTWTLTASTTSLGILANDSTAADDLASFLNSGWSGQIMPALSSLPSSGVTWEPLALSAELSTDQAQSAVFTLAGIVNIGQANAYTNGMAGVTLNSSGAEAGIFLPGAPKSGSAQLPAASVAVSDVLPSGDVPSIIDDSSGFAALSLGSLQIKSKPVHGGGTKLFIQFGLDETGSDGVSLNSQTITLSSFSYSYISNGGTTLQTITGLLEDGEISLFVTNNQNAAGWNVWLVGDTTGADINLTSLFNLPSSIAPIYLTTVNMTANLGAGANSYFYAGLGAALTDSAQAPAWNVGLYLAPTPPGGQTGIVLLAVGPFGFDISAAGITATVSNFYCYYANQAIAALPPSSPLAYAKNLNGFEIVAGNISFSESGSGTSRHTQSIETPSNNQIPPNLLPQPNPHAQPAAATPPQANAPGVVQKTNHNGFFLGGISVSYSGGTVGATVTAGFNIGIISASLLNFKAAYDFQSASFSYTFDGFAISMVRNDQVIGSGMLMRSGGTYAGSLAIGNGDWTVLLAGVLMTDIPASGGGTYNAGFGFVMLGGVDWPVGGLVITSVAAGLGINMTLDMPLLADMNSYPLIEALAGNISDLTNTTSAANAYTGFFSDLVSPADGSGNALVGVSAKTAGGIQITAIADVQWGADFAINIIGEANFTQPTVPAHGQTPITSVQLAVEGDFNPSEGLIQIVAQIVPGSYLLGNPTATGGAGSTTTLSGGAALCCWYSGQNQGDWVVSLGGYAAAFDAPSYYPVVPRLGITWGVASGRLNIAGQAYLTVCSAAFMVGLDVVASQTGGSGSDLQYSVSLSFSLDVLICFAPFSYDIDVAIQLSGTFTASYPIIHFTLQISLGAQLNIMGEPFQGTWSASFHGISASGSFGPSQSAPDLLVWAETANGPPSVEGQFFTQIGGVASPVSITLNSGLSAGSNSSSSASQIVDPTDVAFTVTSQIPVYEITLLGVTQNPSPPPVTAFTVMPMSSLPQIAVTLATSSLAITIDPAASNAGDFDGVGIYTGMPTGLWSTPAGGTITPTLAGLSVGTVVELEGLTAYMPLGNIMDPDTDQFPFNWTEAAVATSDNLVQNPDQQLEQIASAPVSQARAAMVAALAAAGLPVGSEPISFTGYSPNIYRSTPLLRTIGEIKADAA